MNIHTPLMFMAQDRDITEDGWPGDIIGIPNRGALAIGDALTEGEELQFKGIPSFAPELLQKVRANDPMRAKHLGRALQQLAEEGAAHVFKTHLGGDWIVGVIGPLQFDVLAERIKSEYNLAVVFDSTSLLTRAMGRRPGRQGGCALSWTRTRRPPPSITRAPPCFLARNNWHLERTAKDFPDLKFAATKEYITT